MAKHIKFSNSEDEVASELISEVRLIGAIRWLLATTALTIIFLDPKEPDNKTWSITYITLAAYVVYSSTLYWLAIRRVILPRFEWWSHWVDIAWFTLLIGMSTGTNRIFFFGFLFATLVASFRRGFVAGISVVIVSALSITIIGYTSETASAGFEGYSFDVYRFMLRPTFLIVLGYLMAHWGESQLESKRRLALLKDITVSNPRFGVDRTIVSILERVCDFYGADVGLLLFTDPQNHEHFLYKVEPDNPQSSVARLDIPAEFANELLSLPSNAAVCYRCRRTLISRRKLAIQAYDATNRERLKEVEAASEILAATLDAASYITVPTFRHHQVNGRIFFSKSQTGSFHRSDVDFLLAIMEHADPIIENIRLVDTLASDAAERERKRIARDIHDSIIQPYIGFQIALGGLRRKASSGQDLSQEIDQLTKMTSIGVSDLRAYVNRLRHPSDQGTNLLPAIERFLGRFSEATGIKVQLEAQNDLTFDDKLATEVFQMITEGLSNIRRHTGSEQANIKLAVKNQRLVLDITNERNGAANSEPFIPKSINERALSLGGVCRVTEDEFNTTVEVEIPL